MGHNRLSDLILYNYDMDNDHTLQEEGLDKQQKGDQDEDEDEAEANEDEDEDEDLDEDSLEEDDHRVSRPQSIAAAREAALRLLNARTKAARAKLSKKELGLESDESEIESEEEEEYLRKRRATARQQTSTSSGMQDEHGQQQKKGLSFLETQVAALRKQQQERQQKKSTSSSAQSPFDGSTPSSEQQQLLQQAETRSQEVHAQSIQTRGSVQPRPSPQPQLTSGTLSSSRISEVRQQPQQQQPQPLQTQQHRALPSSSSTDVKRPSSLTLPVETKERTLSQPAFSSSMADDEDEVDRILAKAEADLKTEQEANCGHNISFREFLTNDTFLSDHDFRLNEMRRIMQDRFLSGLDSDSVNYREIDENDEYDDIDAEERDAQDRYFDED